MISTSTGKDADDQGPIRPRLGRRGLRWFRYHVGKFVLAAVAELKPQPWNKERVELAREIVAWYVEAYWEYLEWTPDDIYYGAGYPGGGWIVRTNKVRDDFTRALTETLGWLREPEPAAVLPIPPGPIDIDAALAALAAGPASLVEEPRGLSLLDGEAFKRFYRCRDRILRKTPRPCHCCGTMFVGRAVVAITCGDCKAAGLRRCTACREIFSSSGRGPRRCEGCRAQLASGQTP